MKNLLIPILSVLVSFSVFSHPEGHGHHEPTQKFELLSGEIIEASIITFKDDKVYFESDGAEVYFKLIDNFIQSDQEKLINQQRKILAINRIESGPVIADKSSNNSWVYLWIIVTAIILIGIYLKKFHRSKVAIAGIFTVIGLLLLACGDDDTVTAIQTAIDTIVPANDPIIMAELFEQFAGVLTSTDDEYFYISSDGLPSHNMMVGITAWNEQVPVNQGYTGSNSWAIPLQPEFSDSPLSTESNFLKGAIAVAVNGIPIFNPLNNRGEDANIIGELDQWGGHSGRADDYHYHLPPLHLESTVGSESPIAYALDGFPIYGETDEELDEYLGIQNEDGSYQYHTIDTFPYFIAAMRGVVTLDPSTTAPENQIIPQAFTVPVRNDLEGQPQTVIITGFESTGTNSYSMTYTQSGQTYVINYSWNDNGQYTFEFVDPDGSVITKTYN
jgi:hypothetical protein